MQKNKTLFSFPVECEKLPCNIKEKKWENNSQNKDKIINKPCDHEELGKNKSCEPLYGKLQAWSWHKSDQFISTGVFYQENYLFKNPQGPFPFKFETCII